MLGFDKDPYAVSMTKAREPQESSRNQQSDARPPTSPTSPDEQQADSLRRVRDAGGQLTTAAMKRLDQSLPWFASLPAEDRSWVGLVAQAGISAFTTWYANPSAPPSGVGEIFASAPPELTRSISLQHTLQLVRVLVEVVEEHSDQLASPGHERDLREAVLRYSREVAFSAAEVYARAAEVRGAWDARLEALVVDAMVRGDEDGSLRSRVAALGWTGRGKLLAMAGTATALLDDVQTAELRRLVRRAATDALVGIHGSQLVVVLGGPEDLYAAADSLLPRFGPGPVVIGPIAHDVDEASLSVRSALAGLRAAQAWPQAPRPVGADDLLPERIILGDSLARDTLVNRACLPLMQAGGSVLETLSAYLGSGRSLEAAARDLYVHPNTVRYRLRKVTEITGWDPLDHREAYVLQVALAIGQLFPGLVRDRVAPTSHQHSSKNNGL